MEVNSCTEGAPLCKHPNWVSARVTRRRGQWRSSGASHNPVNRRSVRRDARGDGLAIGSAFSAALAFGAVALIVPGTGTPNANIVANYREHARDYYMGGTACSTSCTGDGLIGINYPASFFPLVIFPSWCRSGPEGCDKWDRSVGQGVNGARWVRGWISCWLMPLQPRAPRAPATSSCSATRRAAPWFPRR